MTTTGEIGQHLRTARSALGLLRESLWLRLLLAVALLSVLFVFLGRWQFHRHEFKVARNAVIDANYAASPVPLGQVLPDPAAPLLPSRQWTPVEVTGVYEPGAQVLIRNRPLDGAFGYEVVVPLRTASGAALLVDRGWLPPGEKFVLPATVPAPPGGTVTVVVRLRPGEPPLDRTPPPGQELRIDVARMATLARGEVYRGAYGVLASEQPTAATAPTLLPRPDQSLGPHLAYAFQWWFGALAAWALLGYYAVREVTQRENPSVRGPGRSGGSGGGPSDDGDGPPEGGGTSGGPTGGRRSPAPVVPRSPRRRRELTDEEYEDAASG